MEELPYESKTNHGYAFVVSMPVITLKGGATQPQVIQLHVCCTDTSSMYYVGRLKCKTVVAAEHFRMPQVSVVACLSSQAGSGLWQLDQLGAPLAISTEYEQDTGEPSGHSAELQPGTSHAKLTLQKVSCFW